MSPRHGSEATLVPDYLAQELPKRPVTSQIRATNVTLIEVLGLVQLPVLLKSHEILAERMTSDHVAEVLLGIDWLEAQSATWNMRIGELFMHGQVFALKPKINGGWV